MFYHLAWREKTWHSSKSMYFLSLLVFSTPFMCQKLWRKGKKKMLNCFRSWWYFFKHIHLLCFLVPFMNQLENKLIFLAHFLERRKSFFAYFYSLFFPYYLLFNYLLFMPSSFIHAVSGWKQVIDFEDCWEPEFREAQWVCRVCSSLSHF